MRKVLAGALILAGVVIPSVAQGVRVTADEAHRRVDITIDGQPFTSYIWPTSLKKPVLYPLIADGGITVTRGYPLDPRPGERVDHPHQAGLWFNYGDVSGFDFWNNSDAIRPEDRHKMGTIEQTKIVSTTSGSGRGELVVDSVWIIGENKPILDQTTHYVFTRRGHVRVIDQMVTLKALDRAVFHDDKEGVLGLRVAGWLESPDEKGGEFMDASGKPTKVDGAFAGVERGVFHQRRNQGRSRVGNARAMVRAQGPHRRRYRHHRHSRPSQESRLSDLLACARIRAIRGQSAGAEHLRSQAAGIQFHDREGPGGDLPLSRYAVLGRGGRRRVESRRGCVCG